MRGVAVALVLLSVTGCTSISKEECLQGDWYSIGVDDGKNGRLPTDSFRGYEKECADYGVRPDFAKYQQGHSQGLVFYCDFEHGVAHGRSGSEYNTACTGKLEPSFRQGYQQGRRWYQAKKVVDDIRYAIARIQSANTQMDDEIYQLNQRIVQDPNPNNRASMMYRVDELRRRIGENAVELGRLGGELSRAEAAFAPLNR